VNVVSVLIHSQYYGAVYNLTQEGFAAVEFRQVSIATVLNSNCLRHITIHVVTTLSKFCHLWPSALELTATDGLRPITDAGNVQP